MSHVRRTFFGALLLVLAPLALHAQATGTVRGRVTLAGSGTPIPGAQIVVEGSTLGAATRDDGTYIINGVPVGRRIVVARRIGLAPERREVTVTPGGSIAADFTLREAAVSLDEVVVTGSAAPTSRRALGTSVASVDSTALARSAAVTVDQALQGKVAGAQIQQNSGNPGGGGITVRMRGTSSFISGSDPLYIVDGVIVDNSSASLRDLGARSNVQNRLADINPADIERVEVIRGAAAAALYGSRANNGVVQIFTKRGRVGRPRMSLSTRFAQNELRKRIALNLYAFDAAGLPVTRYDYQDELFRTGSQNETNLSLDGGNEQTTYYINGALSDENGIMKATGSTRRSARVNLSQQVFPRLKVDLGANFVNTHNQFQVNGEGNGVLTSVLFAPTSFSFYPVNGVYPNPVSLINPLLALARFQNPQDIDRFIGNTHARFQLLDNVALDYTLGYDGYTLEQSEFYPRGAFTAGVPATGLSANAIRRSRIINQDGVATLTGSPSSSFNLTTSVGFNFTNQTIRTTSAAANGLIPIGELVSAGSVPSASQSVIELLTLGFYGQQQVAFQEKLYLTGALRADASSTFGPEERWQLFPKISASYVASEDEWFRNTAGRFLSSTRLRVAYGEAGNQPSILNAYQRYDDYIPVSFDTRPGLINSVTLGNSNLKPERQQEIEFGADLGFWRDRASAEITYYDKQVEGLLYFRPIATSTGYSRQFDDIGTISNKGWELLLRTINMDRPNLRWESTVTYSRNKNRVEELTIQDFQSASGYPNRIRAGEPVGIFYGVYAARNCQTGAFLLDSLGRLRPSNSLPDPITALAARQAISGGACNDSINKKLGDPNPEWIGSLLNEFTVAKNLRLRMLLDATIGGDIMNLTKRIQDLGAASNSPEAQRELLPIGDPRRLPNGYFARRLGIFGEYVEDGSFVKLRELSASYTFMQPFVTRVIPSGVELTLTGRNLYVWSDYSGFDPEVNVFGQNPERVGSTAADRGFDFGSYPIPRTWSIAARFTY